jgi:hypothetical protein
LIAAVIPIALLALSAGIAKSGDIASRRIVGFLLDGSIPDAGASGRHPRRPRRMNF